MYRAALGNEFQSIVKPLIQNELKCDGEDPDELCDLSNAEIDKIYTYIGENIVFTAEAAQSTCKSTDSCK